jgi:nicotinic acid mononucleotide adenylyltransferase
MLHLATAENPGFVIDDFELQKGGVSYTYDTIKHLKQIYGEI